MREHLFSHQTAFQRIDIYDTDCFSKVLTLDGHIQLSTLDEFAYHEALVHIPLLALADGSGGGPLYSRGQLRALVVGGGDGGVLRELCRWPALRTIELVEIDADVIDACNRWLPEVSAGALNDPRVNVRIQDAFEFLEDVDQPYDIIVMDITDLYEGEDGALSERLFTGKFHECVKNALSDEGILVTQADNHVFCPYSLEEVKKTLGRIFPCLGCYQALVPSFGGFSAYCWASKFPHSLSRGEPDLLPTGLRYMKPVTFALAFETLPF